MSRPTRTIQPKKGINKRKLMNSMVNIPSTNPDPHYRYKMPALEIRINPARIRTNNLKREPVEVPASTQIQNLAPIAKALNRPVEYLSKYFELELEMQGVMEDRQRWFKLCGGELTEHELMMVLDKFIRRFVLCYICNNPETALTIFNSYIVKECGACGQSTRVDRFSKLTRYLLRNRNFGIGFAPVSVDATR
ncbi:domain found in IF2B/IF5-domain-containing protein [Lobosporangium transversale]|uniref:Domain found in IF2B/IF5-domain-containing protein n=1 Tax=Lobosporangium transversale TaxID=64571 RepID=A0A1Y2H558_9FUNG|nr:domain found in IF2B/IF5-domain-containing protein [Lobosporangium transversale]ORZ28172.1 domain found in IF2B/IF5-domain-containing protein [Lobosporangium transversale]|eukprot:XP_021885857.1 domain found in IF2B/IF5-domain-containing protein [Lobosporangium transversale]